MITHWIPIETEVLPPAGKTLRVRPARSAEKPPMTFEEEIEAAHPVNSGAHSSYAQAMNLVGERHAKADLVNLVNYLLLRAHKAEQEVENYRLGRAMLSLKNTALKTRLRAVELELEKSRE